MCVCVCVCVCVLGFLLFVVCCFCFTIQRQSGLCHNYVRRAIVVLSPWLFKLYLSRSGRMSPLPVGYNDLMSLYKTIHVGYVAFKLQQSILHNYILNKQK